MTEPLLDSKFVEKQTGQRPWKTGKVREVYELGDKLLIVATDRLSAFDVVFPNGIPKKGCVLSSLSEFWFEKTRHIIENHFVSSDLVNYPAPFDGLGQLRGRSMLVEKTRLVPLECVVRGYVVGGGWKEYQEKGSICGIKLPTGLKQAAKLKEPIFTPTTKAEAGHDMPVDADKGAKIVGGNDTFDKIRRASIELYSFARDFCAKKGIIVADTKFEFGLRPDGTIILIDEALTPDSSRFWPADSYKEGISPPSYDKQFVRDWLEQSGWNKEPPAPPLPREVVERTSEKYLEAYEKIAGKKLDCC